MPRLVFLLLTALATCAAAPAAATAATAPCIAGTASPACHAWTGKVHFVADGDTIDVDLAGDRTTASRRIRLTGINATELRRYSATAARRQGECHAVEATARLEQLLRAGRGRVRLTARDPGSRSGSRLRRSVAVKLRGRWQDVGRILVREGHALWLPNGVEWAPNAAYSRLAARARAAGSRLWDADACGPGPADTAAGLAVSVNADAEGNDATDVNGEWVRIKNLDPVTTVPLDGWWLRDSFLRRFTFPAGAAIAPLGTVTVRAGSGIPSSREFFWGLSTPPFDNPTSDERAVGDGAYLFDPQGDLRASAIYPCRIACADPAQGAVELVAQPRGREHVTLRNLGAAPVALERYRLETPPYGYAFAPGDVLAPGATLRVVVAGDPFDDTAAVRHWGKRRRILDDAGDVVRLNTYEQVTVACTAWGRGSC